MPKCICYTHVVMEVIGAHDPMIWIGTCLLGKTNMTVGHESLHSRLTLSSDYFILASLASLKCRSWVSTCPLAKFKCMKWNLGSVLRLVTVLYNVSWLYFMLTEGENNWKDILQAVATVFFLKRCALCTLFAGSLRHFWFQLTKTAHWATKVDKPWSNI